MATNPNPATGLSVTAWSVASHSFLEQLLAFGVDGMNDIVNAKGIADFDAFEQVVKQGQKLTFRQKQANASTGTNAQSNLNITSFNNGTEYVGKFKSGTIKVSIVAPDLKIAANAYKSPFPTGRTIEIAGDFVIMNNALITQGLLDGSEASFAQAMTLTTSLESFEMAGILKLAGQSGERDGIQAEKATWGQQGAATSPVLAVTSLLGEALAGTGQLAISLATGYGTYASPTSWDGLSGVALGAILTELTTTFNDGALIEQSGTFEIQGPLVVTAAT